MSKLINALAATAVVILGSASYAADNDDLFSDVRPSSVFDVASAENSSDGTANASSKRITSPEDLRDMLKSAGFDAKVSSSRTVTMKKELTPWTFPVMLILSEDETSLSIMLGLSMITDVAKELPAKTLLGMMAASQKNAPALFAYHAKRERTELSQLVKNQALTGQILRDEINRLAILAKDTAALWNLQSETTAEPEQKTTDKPQPTTTTFVGKWSAARSATEAFAVEFATDGTFNIVYINNGKQTKTSGKFTTSAGSLSLEGTDGVKLEGKLTVNTDTQFSFTIQNSTALVFKKAS
jgi:hypothetical protein